MTLSARLTALHVVTIPLYDLTKIRLVLLPKEQNYMLELPPTHHVPGNEQDALLPPSSRHSRNHALPPHDGLHVGLDYDKLYLSN